MGYCRSPTLTTLGVLRDVGTPEDQQYEGLGIFGIGDRLRRTRARMRALQESEAGPGPGPVGFQPSPAPIVPSTTRRFSLIRTVARRAAERARAAAAERAAAVRAAAAESERLRREATRVLTVTDIGAGRPIRRVPIRPTETVPVDQPPINGRMTTLPAPDVPPIPWWLVRPANGGAPARDTSRIPTPPGLPGGPTMRPPTSPRDTATERVAPPPGGAPDMAKLLPVGLGLAALLFMGS